MRPINQFVQKRRWCRAGKADHFIWNKSIRGGKHSRWQFAGTGEGNHCRRNLVGYPADAYRLAYRLEQLRSK